MNFLFSDRKPPGVGRGRGRGREEGAGGRPAKGIGRGIDEGAKGMGGGRGRGGPGGRSGGSRGTYYTYLFPLKQSKTIIQDICHYVCLCRLLDLPIHSMSYVKPLAPFAHTTRERWLMDFCLEQVEDVAVADTTKNLRTNDCGIAICLKEGWTKHLSDAAPVLWVSSDPFASQGYRCFFPFLLSQ